MPLAPDRYFSPDPARKKIAQELYQSVADLPLVCPHGHVDPRMFADPNYSFGSPTQMLIIPDHYIFRMLYSQGIALERLGVPRIDGGETEKDHRKIWQLFAEHFHLFNGTPTGIWLRQELSDVFGIDEKLTAQNADNIYDRIAAQLETPAFRPRALFERFKIEVLCTTDAATDTLEYHNAIRESGWQGRIVPTFRPDGVINLDAPNWEHNIQELSRTSGITVHNYQTLIQALENRRAFFKEMGAQATDHAAPTAEIEELTEEDAGGIFQRALAGRFDPEDTYRFTGHMLMQMARMSSEDGLVMQLHIGAYRNHNTSIFNRFGLDKGCDIPMATEFTQSLQPLLERFGNSRRVSIILFTLDESTYSRELAPLAGHYPALRLGPPWWFFDSLNGMHRYFDLVMETAGLWNTAGFNDDTRAFPSIPARHDLWRRASSDWLAGMVARHIIDMDDAHQMAHACAYDLAKQTYHL